MYEQYKGEPTTTPERDGEVAPKEKPKDNKKPKHKAKAKAKAQAGCAPVFAVPTLAVPRIMGVTQVAAESHACNTQKVV